MWGETENPFRPGVGHAPPFFVGRQAVLEDFAQTISGKALPKSMLVTGQQGIGKSALLEQFGKMAEAAGWIVVTNSFSETSALNVERVTTRVISDLARAIANHMDARSDWAKKLSGHGPFDAEDEFESVVYEALQLAHEQEVGDIETKLRNVICKACLLSRQSGFKGLFLSYDEAQFLDGRDRGSIDLTQPLLKLVDSVRLVPDAGPCVLILSRCKPTSEIGRTNGFSGINNVDFISLDRLSVEEAFLALSRPIKVSSVTARPPTDLIYKAAKLSGGHPFLVQVLGKALFEDLQADRVSRPEYHFPSAAVINLLETGFFAAIWNQTTVEHQEFMRVIADSCDEDATDFSEQDAVLLLARRGENDLRKLRRLLGELCLLGLLFRIDERRYGFTVPMSVRMIKRRLSYLDEIDSWTVRSNDRPNV